MAKMEFDYLDWKTFEVVVALLLHRQGCEITSTPGLEGPSRRNSGHDGIDFTAEAPDGASVYVIAKHYSSTRKFSSSEVNYFDELINRLREQLPEGRVIFAASANLPPRLMEVFDRSDVTVWDLRQLEALIVDNVDIRQEIESIVQGRRALDRLLGRPRARSALAPRVLAELAAVPAGRDGWKQFEHVCARILTDIFVLDLQPPEIQCRTEDGLDILDAIFPVPYSGSSWSVLRSDFDTRFIVAEFKNYSDPIGQKEVESIAQYLLPLAFRMFGILVSRVPPRESAIRARRRAWLNEGNPTHKMIVFLSDDDLIEMAQIRDRYGDPYQVIDRQLTGFFRTLST